MFPPVIALVERRILESVVAAEIDHPPTGFPQRWDDLQRRSGRQCNEHDPASGYGIPGKTLRTLNQPIRADGDRGRQPLVRPMRWQTPCPVARHDERSRIFNSSIPEYPDAPTMETPIFPFICETPDPFDFIAQLYDEMNNYASDEIPTRPSSYEFVQSE